MLGAAAVAALALPMGCAQGNSTSDSDTLVGTAAAVAFDDSVNALPIFSDADGAMDSIFRTQGYLFDEDILKAAGEGNVDAQFLLAQMYAYGICGAKPDRRKAFKLFMTLADNGVMPAKATAGHLLIYGVGTEQDVTAGLEMLADAANAGSALANLYLGDFYAKSDKVDYAKMCYAEAVKLGLPEAQHKLDELNAK